MELNGYVQALHVSQRPDVFFDPPPAEVSGWFSDRLLIPDSRAWLAEVGGAPVGYLLLIYKTRPKTPFSRARKIAEIDQIGVHPEFRGQGVGRALVETAVMEVRSAGIDSVELTTWAFNAEAEAFFEKSGFTPMTTKRERSV